MTEERERELLNVIELGVTMRRCQRAYFRAKVGTAEKKWALTKSMAAEHAFDAAAAKATSPQARLFNEKG
jgi:hypothetical protein